MWTGSRAKPKERNQTETWERVPRLRGRTSKGWPRLIAVLIFETTEQAVVTWTHLYGQPDRDTNQVLFSDAVGLIDWAQCHIS